MEQLNISLNKGIRRTPSYAQNGELQECVNLYPKNGELRNIPALTTLKDGTGESDFVLESGHTLVGLHVTGGKRIYISRKEASSTFEIYSNIWEEGESQGEAVKVTGFTTDATAKVLSVGRIMMILDTVGLHYFLWKDEEYKFLGDKIPSMPIRFGLQGQVEWDTVSANTAYATIPEEGGELEGYGGGYEAFIQQVYGKAAEMSADITGRGLFCHPFFIRYALRLYDGSYTEISAPVLMMVSSNEAFLMCTDWHSTQTVVSCSMIAAKLVYYIREGVLDQYAEWKDLVKGVDLFVSAPIYTYNPDSNKLFGHLGPFGDEEKVERWVKTPTVDRTVNPPVTEKSIFSGYGFTVCQLGDSIQPDHGDFYTYRNRYMKHDMALAFALSSTKGESSISNLNNWEALLHLESKTKEALDEEMKGEGPYYLLKQLDLEDLQDDSEQTGESIPIEIDVDRLKNIVTSQVLTETESVSDIKSIGDAFMYNGRLMLSGVGVKVTCPIDVSVLLQHANAYQEWTVTTDEDDPVYPELVAAESDTGDQKGWYYNVEIKSDSSDPFVVSDADESWGPKINMRSALQYLSYPDAEADKAILWYWDTSSTPRVKRGIEISLKPQVTSSNAYYSGNLLSIDDVSQVQDVPAVTADNERKYPNMVIVVEVENPFIYRQRNEYNVGSGRILRLASLTEPLSTGQFGQFPVVAFCTDGLWAIDINTDGTLGTPKPLSPDVLTNLESVTSVEGGLLYITRQGLKMLSRGKEIALLSGTLEGENIDEATFVGPSSAIRQYVSAWASLFVADTAEIRESLQNASLSYDGKNNMVHIFLADTSKQMVLDLSSLEFTGQIDDAGAGKPAAILQVYDESVVQFGSNVHLYTYNTVPSAAERKRGFLLSRILNYGEAEIYSNVMQMKVHNDIDRSQNAGDLKTALYVSNDRKSWALLPSLKGASYKFYRFALFTYMNDLESVSGVSMLYNLARTNKLR